MHIKINYIPILQDNYIWLIINGESGQIIAIDPGEFQDLDLYLAQNKFELMAILLTHHHWDHTNGVEKLVKKYSVPVYGSFANSCPYINKHIQEKENISFSFLDYPITILSTPGHTLDHVSYLFKDCLFCGDTLFSAGCGRLFEGTVEQMWDSLHKITTLPDNTKIYCTHEYTLRNLEFAQQIESNNKNIIKRLEKVKNLAKFNSPSLPSTLYLEKQINPFLRCHLPTVKYAVEQWINHQLHSPIEVFKYLREWKNQW